MKNPVQPPVVLTVSDPMKGGEIDFGLVFDFEAIAHAEDVTGLSLLTGITRKMIDHPTISFVRAMLFASLLANEPKITLAEASAFVTKKSFRIVWDKVLEAWVAAMNEESGEDTADPLQSQG